MDFRELNFEFYLKMVKNISHNTAVKYITNFKKIVLLAIDKEIIFVQLKKAAFGQPFSRFELFTVS